MLLQFFEWLQALPPSAAVQQSAWMQAAINVGHVISLMVFAGAILIVDLRMLGVGLREQPLKVVARDARPWLMGGLWALVLTGLPQFGALAVRNYFNWFFWFKMAVLLAALIYTLTVRSRVSLAEEPIGPAGLKAVAFVSLALWLTVTVAGRMIGLSG